MALKPGTAAGSGQHRQRCGYKPRSKLKDAAICRLTKQLQTLPLPTRVADAHVGNL